MNEIFDRQGGEDLEGSDAAHSEISEFFKDATIFVTGGTGYIGKMFIEKLLRDCNDLKRIYVMVRPKKGKDVQKRFDEIFETPCMEVLKRKYPNFGEKVTLMSGDCALPDVGLDNEDKQKLITEVNCVIHCAATVRFDEKLKSATYINVRSVVDLVAMAKQMRNLKSFLYVSTAFANCPNTTIEEKFYEPPITGEKLLQLVETLDDEKLIQITPTVLGEWPNTYVFTKAVAENVMKTHAKCLPAAVYRPAIVVSSMKEPVAGWIDNLYGATGVLLGVALGLIRSLHGDKNNIAELVPADYVVNGGIAVAWEVANKKSMNQNTELSFNKPEDSEEVGVYNFVSSEETPITWGLYQRLSEKHCKAIPSEHQVWHYCFSLRPNYYHHLIATFLLQTVPAYLVDFILMCIGKKPMLVKGYQKINKFMTVIGEFSAKQWKFKNQNVQTLWSKLSPEDKKRFHFTMSGFNWDDFFYYCSRGARVYLLKDPLDTIPTGRVKYIKLQCAHYVLCSVLLFLAYKFLQFLFGFLF